MEKLKTLTEIREQAIKDICNNLKVKKDTLCDFGQLGLMSVEVLATTFLRDDLRAEVVKFLKLAKKYETDYICLQPPKELEQFNSNKDFPFKLSPGIRQYIIWQNNLTEEDLA